MEAIVLVAIALFTLASSGISGEAARICCSVFMALSSDFVSWLSQDSPGCLTGASQSYLPAQTSETTAVNIPFLAAEK